MGHIVSSEVTKNRISKWFAEAKPLATTWTETRLVIEFGGHVYPVTKGQVFQCAHCGHYDPDWTSQEVVKWFEENLGVKPHEIEVTCSVAMSLNDEK